MKIAVIGLGKLGLPLAALLANSGNQVTGYDQSDSLRELIFSGSFISNEPKLVDLLDRAHENLKIVDSVSDAIMNSEAVFIIVPTPSNESGHFSNKHLLVSLNEIGHALRDKASPTVIDIVSTVMPGSCDNELKDALEISSRLKLGEKLGLCYNPEFIALGSVIKDMSEPDMHLIGASSEWAGDVIEQALSSMMKKTVPCRKMSLIEAELVKISVNNFVTMKISFANQLMQIAYKLGKIDIDTVTEAIGLDSRVGIKYLKAAMPYGGPCFPRDTRAFSALSGDLRIAGSLSQTTEEMNRSHLRFLVDIIEEQNRKTIGILGLSYKIGTSVTEESPGINLAKELVARGYKVTTWDDEGALFEDTRSQVINAVSVEDLINSVELIIIGRPHKNWAEIEAKIEASGKKYLDFWRQ
jgi:UDPglucose 6-dehydrogenase